jgi:hypothetical protein
MALDMIYFQASKFIGTVVSQEAVAKDNIDTLKSDQTLANSMIRGVVEVVCRAVLDGKSDEIQEIQGYINTRQLESKVAVLFGRDTSTTDLVVADKALAEEVTKICRQVVSSLFRGDTSAVVHMMVGGLRNMRKHRQYLIDKLDELRLTPLILRTRCDLCPA